MKQRFIAFLAVTFLFLTTHRLPAPISETEAPTPAPEQLAKPKVKRSSKSSGSDSGNSTAKRAAPPKSQSASKKSIFEGTWVGNLMVPISGMTSFTFVMNAEGTLEKESSVWGTFMRPCTSNGKSMSWTFELGGFNTFTPNPDGKTALLVGRSNLGSWSGVFRKVR
jgi:hypothetical protein